MKKIAAVLLLLLITLSSMGAKSYVGLSLSPYFEFGSGSWMGKDGDSDAAINVTHDEKLFVFGAEFRLDLGLYKRWGKHSLGVEVGTGIALPVIHKNDVGNAALQVNDLQDKPEGLDVSVLSTDSVSGLPMALHPYG